MKKNESEDLAFVPVPARRRRGDNDTLRVDHFAHHSSAAVGGRHQDRIKPELLGSDFLQTAKQDIGRSVRAGKRHSEPAKKRAEHRIQSASLRESESQGGVGPGVTSDVSQSKHTRDGEQRKSHQFKRLPINSRQSNGRITHQKTAY